MTAAAASLVGARIAGRYTIERELGRGGMGAVYVARDERFAQRVALKLSGAGPVAFDAFEARFRREAEIAHRLGRREGFVRALDWGPVEGAGQLYLAMDLIDDAGPLDLSGGPRPERLRRLARAARLVAEAHRLGVVHRDLKPANFLQTRDGELHLTDFGLARLTGEAPDLDDGASRLTGSGLAMGTPAYMPPEQFEDAAAADERADVYALGVMLFFALTGRLPFDGRSPRAIWAAQQAVLQGRASAPAPRAFDPTVPHDLDAVCARALALSPERRSRDAAALSRAIEEAARSDVAGPLEPASASRSRTTARTTIGQAPTGQLLAGAGATASLGADTSAPRRRPPSAGGLAVAVGAVGVVLTLAAAGVGGKTPDDNDGPDLLTVVTPAPIGDLASPSVARPAPASAPGTAPAVAPSSAPTLAAPAGIVAPAHLVLDPVATVTSEARVTLRGRVTPWSGEEQLRLGDSPVACGADGAFAVTRALPDGPHTLELILTRADGTRQRERRDLLVDTSPPRLEVRPIDAPAAAARRVLSGLAAGATHVTAAGHAVALDADGAFEVALDLAPGRNAVEVVAADDAGNLARARVEVVRAPWAGIAVLALRPGEVEPVPLRAGDRVPRGTRLKVAARAEEAASLRVFEVRGDAVTVLHPPTDGAPRLEPPRVDVLAPNRRDAWFVLDAPGEVDVVVALVAPPARREQTARRATAAVLGGLPPPASESPDGWSGAGEGAGRFLVVTDAGGAEHPLHALWQQADGAGLTWSLRLVVE